MSRSWLTVRLVAGAACAALALSACSAAPKHHNAPAVGAAPVAERWWSNSATGAGSAISAHDPTAAAAKLQPSLTDYCGMLKQTLAAGKSIVPGAQPGASDPRLLLTGQAFVAEIEQVAPASVSPAWHVLGPTLITLLRGGGTIPVGSAADSALNLQAVQVISADAKKNCALDLSAGG